MADKVLGATGAVAEDEEEEVVVLGGEIKSSNFHFFPPLSHMLLKIFSSIATFNTM